MKIVVDINPLRQANLSGVGYYLQNVLSRLINLDQTNEYLLVSYGWQNRKIKVDLPQQSNVHYQHYALPGELVFLTSFFRYPNLKGDIIWLPNWNIGSWPKKSKLVLTIHDFSFQKYPQFFNWSRKLWHRLIRPAKLIQQADKLIAVSEHTALDLQELYPVPPEKIIISPLGISTDFKKIDDLVYLQKIKEKYSLSDQFILFVGTREPRKNILAIIQAFSQLDYAGDLVLVGAQGWQEKIWKKHYHSLDLKIKQRIKILNYFPRADLPALYNLAQVLVWPSWYEGFGLPPLEALACGCPVITSHNSALSEVVQNQALLIEALNVQDLRQALEQLLFDSELYAFYKHQEFDQAYYHHGDQAAERLLSLFKKLC